MGHEEEELKPYIEPEADFSDSSRIGPSHSVCVCLCVFGCFIKSFLCLYLINFDSCLPSELMVTMGFPKDEITESLQGQKYDDVMATYLLLGRKAPEVNLCHCDIIIKYTIALVAHSEFLLTFFFFFWVSV